MMDLDAFATDEEKRLIWCYRPKKWTRAVGCLQLTMCVLVAVLVLALVIRPEVVGQRVGKTTAWMIAVAIWILLALASVTIILLLVGNEKERPGFFIPWLIANWISIVISVVAIIGGILTGEYRSTLGSVGQPVMSGFFIYVVQQRYNEVKADRSISEDQERAHFYEKASQDEA